MTSPINSRMAVAAALATVLLWASAFPMNALALRSFDPASVAALRFAGAGLVMLVWWIKRRPPLPTRADMGRLVACAALGVAAYNVLLATGQRSVSAGAASFIVNTVPILTALLAVALLGERFSLRAWSGTAIGGAGITLIALSQPGGLQFGSGAWLVLAAAACQAGFFATQRGVVARLGAPATAAAVVMLGGVLLLPWLPSAMAQAQAAPWAAVLAVLYLAVGPAAIGFATWTAAQAYFGAAHAANFLYLVPLVATALSHALLGESPSPETFLGGVLALIGVALVNARAPLPIRS